MSRLGIHYAIQSRKYPQISSSGVGFTDRNQRRQEIRKWIQKKVFRGEAKDGSDDITILDAHRWTLEKSALIDGKFVTTTLGIAYAWEEWQVGDSTVCSAGGKQRVVVDVAELEAQLEQQAAFIRNLKDEHGLGNKDPEVVDAVEKLLKLKELIAAAA